MKEKVDTLLQVSAGIEQQVNTAVDRYRDLPDKSLEFRPSKEDWSVKEIIGHLIDSASNNHQRFVRLQLLEKLTFPDYGQDNIHWVRIQNYQDRPWHELLSLWRYYNIQLVSIIRCVDPSCLDHVWHIDTQNKISLFDLMTDYLRHLKIHLDQIADNLAAVRKR
jgi:hypothetical protein